MHGTFRSNYLTQRSPRSQRGRERAGLVGGRSEGDALRDRRSPCNKATAAWQGMATTHESTPEQGDRPRDLIALMQWNNGRVAEVNGASYTL